MPPIGPPHSHSVNNLETLFARRVYSGELPVAQSSIQNPIQLDEYGAPQPDIVLYVVLYVPEMPTDHHLNPDDIYIVVEVAEPTVDYDRQGNADRCAAAGIPEYWLVDPGQAVDVFRRPEGDGHAERVRHRHGDGLSLAALPGVTPISVEEILGEME